MSKPVGSKAAKGADKRATNEITVQQFNHTSTSIGGTADGLRRSLKELEAELKKDEAGKKEYEAYLKRLEIQRADLQRKVDENRAWLDAVEAQGMESAESKYKQLLDQIQQIYEGAKEFHGKGIDLLIKEFGYHIAYKRWNDTFTAIPFKPK
ncbi:FAP286 protein [Gonium pectorale]|uniref:FAP286 protein n=1 Tax=Gonium pectorale TaxID=33097 RepID=A0A150H1N4_GONPE|nr:FAP286 protein [Gonium pectorale]|eukprot:KXZ55964.1 FAP286 protein [Gonium pectorale]